MGRLTERFTPSYPHKRPLFALIGAGATVSFLASLTILVLLEGFDFYEETVRYAIKPYMIGWSALTAFCAGIATAVSWYLMRMHAQPTRRRGVSTPFIAVLVLTAAFYLIIMLFQIVSGGVFVIRIFGQFIVSFFITILFLWVILSPVIAPIGWFIGRWADRLHRDATAPETIADTFT